jgi:Domain of unknown function (DUF4149)
VSALRRLLRLLLVFTLGSMWSLAAWVAPTLFLAQPNRALAGLLAGRLFRLENYLCIGVALLALVLPGRLRFRWLYVAAALLAANEWLLRPRLDAARLHGAAAGFGFAAWHGLSSLLYVLACLAGVLLVWNDDLR